jgi:CRISPR-associated protein Cmr5
MNRSESTTRNTLEQGRAQHAFEQAKKYTGDKEKFASYAKKLPMMIKTNGLGASMAFAKAKNEKAWKELFQAIEEWLKEKNYVQEALLEELVKMDSTSYRILTNEIIAYLSWLRRFAEGNK